jgi:hypothetical protein
MMRVNSATHSSHDARRKATKTLEAATSPMQYAQIGASFLERTSSTKIQKPCDDETLRTPKVRASPQLTRQCMLAEDRSMEIMVTMNRLALELLPLVPDFELEEMKKKSAGTHDINRRRVKQALGGGRGRGDRTKRGQEQS